MEPSDYFRILVRHKWIVLTSILATVLCVSIYVFISKPEFEANAKLLLVDDKDLKSMQGISFENLIMGTLGKSDPISTQIEILKTRTVMNEVIKLINLTDNNGYPLKYENLLKGFNFEAIHNTNIISIRYKDVIPENAAEVVNALTKCFVEKNEQFNQDEVKSTRRFIENQLSIQKAKLDETENAVMKFKSREKIVSINKETDLRIDALADLQSQKVKLQSDLFGIQAQKYAIDCQLNKIGSQAAPLYSDWYNSSEQLRIKATTLESQLSTINAQIQNQYKNLKTLPPLEIEFDRLTREQKLANDLYTNLLSRYEETKMKEAAEIANIKILEPASIPIKPCSPGKFKFLAFAIVGGLFLAFSLIFFIEFITDIPFSTNEIKRILGCKVIGSLPSVKKTECFAVNTNPLSPYSRSIQLAYTNLILSNNLNEIPVLMITHADDHEDMLRVSINIGLCFSKSGINTVLFNIDRSASLNDLILNKQDAFKSDDFINGNIPLKKVIIGLDIPNFSIIDAGKDANNSSIFTSSQNIIKFISILKNNFGCIIISSPQISSSAQSLRLSKYADGVVITASLMSTKRKGLKAIHEVISINNISLYGIICTSV